MTDSQKGGIKDNIWLTSKARMVAERRFKNYSLASHILLTYFSFFVIVMTVFSTSLSIKIAFYSEITISLSIAVFALSLVVSGFRLDETARSHRDCYLRLQDLYRKSLPNEELLNLYDEILRGHPNHDQSDYEDFIIQRTLVQNKKLWDTDGPLNWTWSMLGSKILRLLRSWIIVIFLILLPPILVIWPIL